MKHTGTIVVGLGNLLMSDEGVGIHVIRRLSEDASQYPNTEFLDLGCGGMTVIHALAHRHRAILVDCAWMDATPGAIRRFLPRDVRSRKTLAGFSLHEGDMLSWLNLSRRLGECPPDVVIFGIQPLRIEPGDALSPPLSRNMDSYVKTVAAEIDGRRIFP